jgi:hypothetical protein
MGPHIRNPRARELAQKLAERRGCSLTEVVVAALEREAALEEAWRSEKIAAVRQIQRRVAELPELRPGLSDKDLYDEEGQPILRGRWSIFRQ